MFLYFLSLKDEKYFGVCTHHILSVYSSIDGPLTSLYFFFFFCHPEYHFARVHVNITDVFALGNICIYALRNLRVGSSVSELDFLHVSYLLFIH